MTDAKLEAVDTNRDTKPRIFWNVEFMGACFNWAALLRHGITCAASEAALTRCDVDEVRLATTLGLPSSPTR